MSHWVAVRYIAEDYHHFGMNFVLFLCGDGERDGDGDGVG